MKRITPILLTAFSAFALSFSVSSFADDIDNDGFIVFEAQTTEVAPAASAEVYEQSEAPAPKIIKNKKKRKAKKKVARKTRKSRKKARQRVKRASRKVRNNKRTTRTSRGNRSKSLRRASSYKIRRGDTLYRISVNSGVKLSRLIRLNKLGGSKKHKIQAGQRIRLR